MTRSGWLAAALAFAALHSGCAKSAPPPGGPPDTTPPRVLLSTPADSSVRFPVNQSIEFLFSEPMDHTSVRDAVRVYPSPGPPSFDWSGRRFRVTWSQALRPGTTYQAFLSGAVRDIHGVALGQPITIRFSTGDSIDRGRISGVLHAKTLPTKGVPVLAYPESLGLTPDMASIDPSYATETDTAAAYAFVALPPAGGFTIHAFYDINRNGSFDAESDVTGDYPEVIRLTPDRAVADSINLVAVDPRAPALVSGAIVSPDSTARFRIEARREPDSLMTHSVGRKGAGDYLLRLPPGKYRLRATRLPGPAGIPAAQTVEREGVLDARAEEEFENLDFRFEAAEAPEPQEAEPPPEPEE